MREPSGLGQGLLGAFALGLFFVGGVSTAQAQYYIDNASETVPGNHSSPWVIPDDGALTVGYTGTGALTIIAGGIVTSTSGDVGSSAGSTGTVTITGTGSRWNGGPVNVGNSGTGTLNIENGGSFFANNSMNIGLAPGSTGTVTVTGAGSSLNVTPQVFIGADGNGTLNIENGATFSSQGVTLSQTTGSGAVNVSGGSTATTGTVNVAQNGNTGGTMNVSGAGTTWTINGGLEISHGGSGGGTVNITDGAHVSASTEVTVGYDTSAYTGSLTISGANSLLSTAGSAYIGYDSAASVLVSDGGKFEVANTAYLSSDPAGPATVTVTGQGSEWTNGYLYVGYYGAATANVLDGAHASTTTGLTVGDYNTGQAILNISGAGSQLVSNGDAYIGYEGNGSVNVSNGGLFQVNGTSYLGDGNAGSVVVTGAGSLWKAQDIQAGIYYDSVDYPDSRGDISVLNGGAIQATSMELAVAYAGTPGTLLVSGPGSSVVLTGGLVVGDAGNGIATIADGGAVAASSVTIANHAGSTGKLIFGAASGSAPVTAGSLNTSQVSFGSGTGEIDFNHLDAYTFTPVLSGAGSINVLAGTTAFSTDSNGYSGTVDVTGGKAVFNAALPGDVEVSGSGIVGGNGTIKSLTADAGGTVAPGNSIGKLNVTNSVTFNSGSTYAVELNAAGQSDLIYTSGTATLNGGTVKTSGTYAVTTYTILTAMDGVSGTFDNLESGAAGSPFLNLALSYDADNVYLNVTRGASFEDAAKTANQRQVARAIDALPGDNPLSMAMASQQSFAGARQAFDATSGEIHASVGTALADNTRYIRDAINGRMIQSSYGGDNAQPIVLASSAPTDVATIDVGNRMSLGFGSEPAPRGSGLAYWSRAFGAWGQYDGNGNAATTDRSVGGFISGIDAGMGGGWRAGVTGGYMYTGLDADARASSANVDSYIIGAYAGGPVGSFAVRTGGTWMWNDIDTSRAVSFPGFYEAEKASYNGNTGQLFGEVALPMARNGHVLEPFAGLAYVHVGTDGFKENGSDAGLTSGGNNGDLGVGTLGARIGTTVTWRKTTIVPHASLAWQYAFGDITPFQSMAFNGTNVGFDVGGVPLAQNSALLEVGADMSIGYGATLGLSYIGQYAGREQDNGLRGRLNWKF